MTITQQQIHKTSANYDYIIALPPFPPSSGAEPEGIPNDPTHQGGSSKNIDIPYTFPVWDEAE